MNPKPGLRWCAAIASICLTTSFVPSSNAASVALGTEGFYQGWVEHAIVASSQAGKGPITQADLDSYKTRELAPGGV
jgi:hypothetical protein